MQNIQNAAEIQQRVINLVELYRTKVGKESKIAKDAKADNDFWKQESVDMMMEEGQAFGGIYGEGTHTEVWIKHLMVNEQLLGHFYSVVAGANAEKDILDQLLPDVYDKTIFTEEDELFLRTHFKEMVNYIILTPCDDSLDWVHRHDCKDAYTIPSEVLELIKARVEIPAGSTVYYPHTAFAQLANLFDGCKYYCDTMFYAWTKIALYANGIKAEDNGSPSSYDAVISYMPKDNADSKAITRLCDAYKSLPVNGKLVLICPPSVLVGKDNTSYRRNLSEMLKHKDVPSIMEKLEEEKASADVNAQFRKMLVEDKSIQEIIQLPQVMSNNASRFETYCVLIAEKGRTENDVLLVDARTASNDSDTKHYMLSFDNAKFNAIMHNGGIDPNTGLRKIVTISADCLSTEQLVPQVYTIERPSEAEHPVPLSTLCTLETTSVRDVQYDLPEDTPWISMSDLTPLFTGDMDLSTIRKAYCPNNPRFVEGSKDYAFNEEGEFVDSIWDQMYTKRGNLVLEYRLCTFIDGNSDNVLYECSVEHGVHVAIVRSTDKPFAVSKGILVFRPKNGVEANTLAAILRLPIVRRQLLAYKQFGIDNHLSDIFVPTDKRVVGDELYRMEREKSVTDELGEKVQAMKTDYINEVRMRKHDMRPHLRQLASSQRLMSYYINSVSNIDELKKNLKSQLEHSQSALGNLSAIVDHLSDEEQFGESELLNIDDSLSNIEVNHDNGEGFVIEYECNNDSFLNSDIKIPNIATQLEMARERGVDMVDFIREKAKEKLPLFVNIAGVDFQRLVINIVENARWHGFTDKARNDYYIGIELSYNSEREMYQIDFSNNGNPLPDGMTKSRFGIKGEKAGLTAGTGSGGYIVKSIVNHYGGDYDIFCKDGITTVRILLPIATL